MAYQSSSVCVSTAGVVLAGIENHHAACGLIPCADVIHAHPKVNAKTRQDLPLVLYKKVNALLAQVGDEVIRALLVAGNLPSQQVGEGVAGVVRTTIFARDDCAVLVSLCQLAKLLVREVHTSLDLMCAEYLGDVFIHHIDLLRSVRGWETAAAQVERRIVGPAISRLDVGQNVRMVGVQILCVIT